MKKFVTIILTIVLVVLLVPAELFCITAKATGEEATVFTAQDIQSIEIEDVEIIAFSDSYRDGEYSLYSLMATVTFADGSKELINGYLETEDRWYSIDDNASQLQSQEAWTVGNTYEVTGTLADVSDTFNVTIVPSPVESITFEDIVIYEGIHSYDSLPFVLSEVKLKDGTMGTVESDTYDSYFVYEGNSYYVEHNAWELQEETPWVAGNTYTVTGTLLGVSSTFQVTVEESPVRNLEIIKMPDKTEQLVGENYDPKGAVLRLNFIDGTHEDFTIDQYFDGFFYGKRFESEKLNSVSGISLYSEEDYVEIGTMTYRLSMFDATCSLQVEVKENLSQSLTIRESADKSIIITVHNSDNTSYDMQVLDMVAMYFEEEENGTQTDYGTIITDKGSFDGYIYKKDGSVSIGLFSYDSPIISNSIPYCQWFMVHKTLGGMHNVSGAFAASYTGEVTAENIDMVVAVAASFADVYYGVLKGEWVRATVEQYFGIENVDLTLSKFYYAETDAYNYTRGSGMPFYGRLNKITFDNGVWSVESNPWGTDEVRYKLTEDGKIISISINVTYTPGDLDGVEGVTDADAVYLLYHTFLPGLYPVNQDCDFNGDGEVNDVDAVYLLYHTFLPDLYPIS